MKVKYLLLLFVSMALSACGPSQKIVNSWINPEAGTKGPYKQIFIMVLAPSKESSFSVEDRMAEIIASRGNKYVLSSSVFPPNISISENFSREQMGDAIKRTGCDAVFVIALMAEIIGLATSFVVFVSPSAIAGILASLSYLLALQIRRVRDRVHVELEDVGSDTDDVEEVLEQTLSHEHSEDHEH